MHKLKKLSALLLSGALLLSVLTGCGASEPVMETTQAVEETVNTAREGIQTVLAVSLADFQPEASSGFRNGSRADMLMLMVVDEAHGRTAALQLNPDILVPFRVPGTQEETELPLGEVYSFGSGGSDSCLSLLKSVSDLLGGIKMDHYLIFSQGAIGIVSDVMGGLEVIVPEDFSRKYPEFTSGEQALLTGDHAEDFFAFRDPDDAANELHMTRQQQFVTALYLPFTEKMQQEDFLTKLTMALGDRLSTDLALSQMVQLMAVMEACELEDTIVTLSGTLTEDGDSCRADAGTVDKIVEELFY